VVDAEPVFPGLLEHEVVDVVFVVVAALAMRISTREAMRECRLMR
jgi:hypothetical protein